MILTDMDYDVALDPTRNKYRSLTQSSDRLLDEVWPTVTPSFHLHPGAKIFTIGSCFARNIEDHLQLLGFKIPTLDFEVSRKEGRVRPNTILNKYTPAAIFQEIEWGRKILLKGGRITEADSEAFLYQCGNGLCIDTNLTGFVPVTHERFFQRRSNLYDTFKEVFSADCVVITLGLIESWFDREKGVYIHKAPVGKNFIPNRARFGFERLSYDQSRRFLQNSIDSIRDVNKDAKFLITTSPVPLTRTFTDDDVIIANMHSKSVLRAVAGEIAASNKEADYFPSYESVMLTKSWNVWQADLIHVSDLFVGKIVARLIDAYCSDVEEARKLFQQSHIELSAGELGRALEFALQAVERSPQNGDLRKYLGELLARKGDLKEAEAQLVKGIELRPRDPAFHHQLSDVLARQGRLEEAIEAAEQCTELMPEKEEFHKHLGHLWARQWKLGRAALQFALAAGHRRLKKTKRRRLKHLLRFSLPLLQKMSSPPQSTP